MAAGTTSKPSCARFQHDFQCTSGNHVGFVKGSHPELAPTVTRESKEDRHGQEEECCRCDLACWQRTGLARGEGVKLRLPLKDERRLGERNKFRSRQPSS